MSCNLRQRGENWSFHFPFLCLYICLSATLCGMFSAASPRHICSNARTFLQGHCLHDNFGCLFCTSNHSVLQIHIRVVPESSSWAGTQSPETKVQTLLALCNPWFPKARRSAGTAAPGPCMKCYAVHCKDSKAGENRLSLHQGRLECVGGEESEPAQASIHPCKSSCGFQLCKGLISSVQLNHCSEMKLWAAAAQSCVARTGPC